MNGLTLGYITTACAFVCLTSCGHDSDPDQALSTSNLHRPIESAFDLGDTTHYSPVVPFHDPGGIRIAGHNKTSTIRQCTSINGLSITELEALMRPGNHDDRMSNDGFLGANERLLSVLAADNDTVDSLGLTHRDLAIPLLQICHHALRERKRLKQWDSVEVTHANSRWRIDVTEYKGFQLSPFNDQTQTNIDYKITNLTNGESLTFSGLVPIMIERYGFYEGRGTPYRVEPTDIAVLLGLHHQDNR